MAGRPSFDDNDMRCPVISSTRPALIDRVYISPLARIQHLPKVKSSFSFFLSISHRAALRKRDVERQFQSQSTSLWPAGG